MQFEKKILEFDEGQVVLTSHRVRYDASTTMGGQRKMVSIMLDELCSCELIYRSKIIFLILAALSVVVSVAFMNTYFLRGFVPLLILATIAFVAAWFWTRKQALSLSSAGATIDIQTKGMSTQVAVEFIDAVELAKFEIRK